MIASDGCLFACGGAAYIIDKSCVLPQSLWTALLLPAAVIVNCFASVWAAFFISCPHSQCGLLLSFPVPTGDLSGLSLTTLFSRAWCLKCRSFSQTFPAVNFFILTMNSLSTNVIWWFWYNMMIVKVEWSSMCFRHVRSPYLHCRYRWCFPTHTGGFSHSREEHDSIVDACGLLILHVWPIFWCYLHIVPQTRENYYGFRRS